MSSYPSNSENLRSWPDCCRNRLSWLFNQSQTITSQFIFNEPFITVMIDLYIFLTVNLLQLASQGFPFGIKIALFSIAILGIKIVRSSTATDNLVLQQSEGHIPWRIPKIFMRVFVLWSGHLVFRFWTRNPTNYSPIKQIISYTLTKMSLMYRAKPGTFISAQFAPPHHHRAIKSWRQILG